VSTKKIAYARCSLPSFLRRNQRYNQGSSIFAVKTEETLMSTRVRGAIFVLDDNIDTDQIIPAEYLTLVPSKPEEYEKLGSYALVGLPDHYLCSTRRNKDALPHHYRWGKSVAVLPGTRTYCPLRRRRKGSSCSVLRPIFSAIVATGELYPWSQLSDCVSSFRLVKKFLSILNKIKSSIIPLTRYIVSSLWEK